MTTTVKEKPKMIIFWPSAEKGTYRRNGELDKSVPASNRQQRRAAFKAIRRSYFTKKFANEGSRRNAFQSLPEKLKHLLIRVMRTKKLFAKA